MKKIIILFFIILSQCLNVGADTSSEIKRIIVGNNGAKINIIVYESLTCSHCANFHINVFPELKREYIQVLLK